MKNWILRLLVAAVAFGGPAFAQTAMTNTTLSVAYSANNGVYPSILTLASATNVSANGYLYIDHDVFLVTTAYVSGTVVNVKCGSSSTKCEPHNANAVVWVVAPGTQARLGFRTYTPYGGCTRVNEAVLPIFNVLTGESRRLRGRRIWNGPMEHNGRTTCAGAGDG